MTNVHKSTDLFLAFSLFLIERTLKFILCKFEGGCFQISNFDNFSKLIKGNFSNQKYEKIMNLKVLTSLVFERKRIFYVLKNI